MNQKKNLKETIQPAFAVLWTAEGEFGIYSPLNEHTQYTVFYDKKLAEEWLQSDKIRPEYRKSSVIVPCTITYENPVVKKKMPPKTK